MIAGRKYTFHADGGHGWLEVNRTDLVALDIVDKITPYSYQHGSKVFLEEDCDLSVFVKAYEDKFGGKIVMDDLSNHVYDGIDSPIRGYASYRKV